MDGTVILPLVTKLRVPLPPILKAFVGDAVPIPTLPLSNTDNEALVFQFCTSKAVVALVVPEPKTCNLEEGEVVPIPTFWALVNVSI